MSPGSLVGNRFRLSQADLCADVLGARAQQVKREVYSILTVFLSSVPWTWIQLTVKWIGVLLLPCHCLQHGFQFSSNRAEL